MGTGDPLDFGAEPLHVLAVDRLSHPGNCLVQGLRPDCVPSGLDQTTDGWAGEQVVRHCRVQLVILDLPASPDDAAGRKIQPGGAPSDLPLLPVRQPEPILVETVVEQNTEVLQLTVEVGTRGKAEA